MNRKTVVTALAFLFASTGLLMASSQSEKIRELERRIEKLEQALCKLQGKKTENQIHKDETENQPHKDEALNKDVDNSEKNDHAVQHIKFRRRKYRDSRLYLLEELIKAEKLYLSKGYKDGSPEKTKNLKQVVSEFPESNRAGCAVLYLGQFSKDPGEKIDYLKKAISKYEDCFYTDGVQVGAYARFWLARIYLKAGKKSEALKLFDEINDDYPDAVDHRGRSLATYINYYKNSISKL